MSNFNLNLKTVSSETALEKKLKMSYVKNMKLCEANSILQLPAGQLRLLLVLADQMQREINVIDLTAQMKKEFAEFLNQAMPTFSSNLSYLSKSPYVVKVHRNRYFINPHFCSKNAKNETLIQIWDNYLADQNNEL